MEICQLAIGLKVENDFNMPCLTKVIVYSDGYQSRLHVYLTCCVIVEDF